MAIMTASGWTATAVEVVRAIRPWGAHGGKETVVKLSLVADGTGLAGNLTYPTNGIPLPGPSMVGLRRIDYVIPISPIFDLRAGVTTFARHSFAWGVYHPSYSASGVTTLQGGAQGVAASAAPGYAMRIIGGYPHVSGSLATDLAGTNPSFRRRSCFVELTTNITVSDIVPSTVAAPGVAYAVFGEF